MLVAIAPRLRSNEIFVRSPILTLTVAGLLDSCIAVFSQRTGTCPRRARRYHHNAAALRDRSFGLYLFRWSPFLQANCRESAHLVRPTLLLALSSAYADGLELSIAR